MTEQEFHAALKPLTPEKVKKMALGDKAIAIATGVDTLEWGAQVVKKGYMASPNAAHIAHSVIVPFYSEEIGSHVAGRMYRKSDLKELGYEKLQDAAESTTLYEYSDEIANYISKNYKSNSYYRNKLNKELNRIRQQLNKMGRDELISHVQNKSELCWTNK